MARVSRHWNVRMCWSYHGLRWKTHRNLWPRLVVLSSVWCRGKVGGKRWWGMHFSVDIRHPYRFLSTRLGRQIWLHPMICQIWKIYLLAIWSVLFPAAWQCFFRMFFFSSHENLTIANWYDFWHVFTFTSNPMSRSAVSWGMVPGYIFGSQYDASVTNEAAVLVWQKKTNQRPKDVLFKPTSLTYATEN